ncbi:MAG: hypothetical protein WC789_04380 [Lentisphaeria bacterium]
MLYHEPVPKRTWWILILGLFLVLHLPHLGLRELRREEAILLAVADGLGDGWFQAQIHGQPVQALPLVPGLMRLVATTGLPPEWCARLPAALAILGLAGLAGWMAGRMAGHLAGAVAAAVCVSAYGVLGIASREPVVPVGAFFLAAAWFLWYRFGRMRHQWAMAWATGLGLATLAFFCIGLPAFLIFYLPLLLLRRPLRVWPRIWNWGHLLTLASVAALLWAWHAGQPPGRPPPAWGEVNVAGFFHHLLAYPLATAVQLLPWTFLAWPGFCAAFRPVERTPVFCSYLRTILLSVWIGGWLLPTVRPEQLHPLLAPLAVLTGIHADILLRRHFRPLFLLPEILFRGGTALAVLATLLLATIAAGWLRLAGLDAPLYFLCLGSAFAALLLGIGWLRRRPPPTFLAQMLAGIVCATFAIQAFYPAWRMLFFETRRAAGAALAAAVPPGATVFLPPETNLPVETLYLRRPARRIQAPAELPETAAEAYVLGGAKPPLLETRSWEAVSPPIPAQQRSGPRWHWLPEEGGLLRIERGASPAAAPVVRMYRGTLKTLREPAAVPAAVPAASLNRQPPRRPRAESATHLEKT